MCCMSARRSPGFYPFHLYRNVRIELAEICCNELMLKYIHSVWSLQLEVFVEFEAPPFLTWKMLSTRVLINATESSAHDW